MFDGACLSSKARMPPGMTSNQTVLENCPSRFLGGWVQGFSIVFEFQSAHSTGHDFKSDSRRKLLVEVSGCVFWGLQGFSMVLEF